MDDEKYGTLQVDTPWYIYFCLFPLGGSPTNIMPLVSFLHLKCVLLIYRSRISVSGGNRNVIYSHLFGSENGFSVSDPTDEAEGQVWRGGDRKVVRARKGAWITFLFRQAFLWPTPPVPRYRSGERKHILASAESHAPLAEGENVFCVRWAPCARPDWEWGSGWRALDFCDRPFLA